MFKRLVSVLSRIFDQFCRPSPHATPGRLRIFINHPFNQVGSTLNSIGMYKIGYQFLKHLIEYLYIPSGYD